MNNSTLLQKCDTANYLAHNTKLAVMLIIRLFVSVVGLILFALLFKVKGTNMAFHSNARVLFISHLIWTVLQAISNLLCHSFMLIRYTMKHENPCDFLLTATEASLAKGPSVFTVHGQVWSLAAMAIERCFATYKYRDYEKTMSVIGKLLTAAQWLMASLWMGISLSGADFDDFKAYPTISSSKTSSKISTLLFILAGVEITAFCIILGLLWYNCRKSRQIGGASLTEKYQISENIRTTKLMIPMVLTHFCFFMPTLIGLPVYMKFIDPTVDQRYYTVYMESINCSPFYCISLPIVLFWRRKVLRQNLQKVIGVNVISFDAPRNQHHLRHFALLKDVWKGPSA
uniref:Uncharacterized protein n=1 Tax=Plectus sambesii TaxID=2011161 RepID=A0A914XDY1_9BILA